MTAITNTIRPAFAAKVLPSPQCFAVEKGIPIPEIVGNGRPSEMANGIRTMQVGDSMLIPEKRVDGARKMARKLGIKLCTRKAGDGMRRIWRVR
jgi:hypothetical protein